MEAIAIIAVIGLAVGLWVIRRDRAEIEALKLEIEIANGWTARWEAEAEAAAEEAENAMRKYGELQHLYCRLVSENIAASWPTVRWYAALRRSSTD